MTDVMDMTREEVSNAVAAALPPFLTVDQVSALIGRPRRSTQRWLHRMCKIEPDLICWKENRSAKASVRRASLMKIVGLDPCIPMKVHVDQLAARMRRIEGLLDKLTETLAGNGQRLDRLERDLTVVRVKAGGR